MYQLCHSHLCHLQLILRKKLNCGEMTLRQRKIVRQKVSRRKVPPEKGPYGEISLPQSIPTTDRTTAKHHTGIIALRREVLQPNEGMSLLVFISRTTLDMLNKNICSPRSWLYYLDYHKKTLCIYICIFRFCVSSSQFTRD